MGDIMLTNQELIEVEKKYFLILSDLIEKNLGKVISQINSQKLISSPTTGMKENMIEKSVENIIESIIASQLGWNISSLPVSSDSCFECGDAIVHIDAKTIKKGDGDEVSNKVNVRNSQTTYDSSNSLIVTGAPWQPQLSHYEEHAFFGRVPNITFIVKVIYSDSNLVEKISLICLPHGQLASLFNNQDILGAGKNGAGNTNRSNIRFLIEKIKTFPEGNWREKILFIRK